MTNPIRAALERLIEALDDYEPVWGGFPESALAAARAALAEQQGERPSDIPPGPFSEHELREQWNQQADEFNQWDSLDSCEQLAWAQARAIQRDRNARPTPPAEGEVAELLAELEVAAVTVESEGGDHEAAAVRRAAELLQQQEAKIESLEQQLETERMRVVACGIIAMSDTPFSASKNRNCHPDYWSASADDIARQIDELMRLRAQQTPVPVSERPWEREGWCDKQGLCWCLSTLDGLPHRWWLVRPEPLSHGFVLPAYALPLPQGEVE